MNQLTIGTMHKIYIFLLISATTILGLLYGVQHSVTGMFWPVAGFFTAYAFAYRRQIVPWIAISLFATYLLYLLIEINEPWWVYIVMAITFTIGNIVEMYLFTYLIDRSKIDFGKLSDISVGKTHIWGTDSSDKIYDL